MVTYQAKWHVFCAADAAAAPGPRHGTGPVRCHRDDYLSGRPLHVHHRLEPLWVGMDVQGQLRRTAEPAQLM